MRNPICPLYHRGYASDGHDALKAKHKSPAMHVGPNALYCQTAESIGVAEDHDELVVTYLDEQEQKIDWPATEWWIAQRLVNPERKPLYARLNMWEQLVERPTARMYSGKYDAEDYDGMSPEERFRADIDYVTAIITAADMPDALEQWKAASADATPETIPGIMLQLILSFRS